MKKIINILLILIAGCYSLYYASLGGFRGNAGALSKIGLTHHILFIIWGIITYFVLSYNIVVGFRQTKYKFYIIPLIIAAIGMILTLAFDFDYALHTDYMLHCIGSMTFSIVMGILVFVLFLLRKEYILTAVCGSILAADFILLIIFKETAIIELLPIFSGYVMLGIMNSRKEREPIGIK
ncbi:MAG: hypothetical protein NC397_03135 [Clostridium sp.]|nr:hypothetical protein [Clostridium sp.]